LVGGGAILGFDEADKDEADDEDDGGGV